MNLYSLAPRALVVAVVILSTGTASIAHPQTVRHGSASGGVLTEFDAPGSTTQWSQTCAPLCGTLAYSNNAQGAVVGAYTDKFIVPHGFIRSSNGSIATFDAPP